MSAITSVGVVVPARDESERIERCLRRILDAARLVDVSCTIVVVDDDSSDDTAAVASRTLARHDGAHDVIEVCERQASRARARGVEHLRTMSPAASRDTWLLSTDADTLVPPDWMERHLAHAERGAVAVAGVVDLIDDPDGRLVADVWQQDYGPTIIDGPAHPHVHAANLGIRLDVYDRAGGFADVDRAEDIDLWNRVRALGHQPVADTTIVVATSGRLIGRVDAGFAGALRRLVAG